MFNEIADKKIWLITLIIFFYLISTMIAYKNLKYKDIVITATDEEEF